MNNDYIKGYKDALSSVELTVQKVLESGEYSSGFDKIISSLYVNRFNIDNLEDEMITYQSKPSGKSPIEKGTMGYTKSPNLSELFDDLFKGVF